LQLAEFVLVHSTLLLQYLLQSLAEHAAAKQSWLQFALTLLQAHWQVLFINL
jgi:hypothetical protein